jgi:hypothetical protein
MASQKEAGRPMKFRDPADMQRKIDEYFGNCDPHVADIIVLRTKADGTTYQAKESSITEQIPYTITGLALALDTNRFTLLNYEDPEHYPDDVSDEIRQQLIDTVKRAKLKVHEFAERRLFTTAQATGPIFALKNNFGWKDESELVTRKPEDDLDDLEELNRQKQNVGKKAKEKLEGKNGEGSEAPGQVVAPDQPVQDQG